MSTAAPTRPREVPAAAGRTARRKRRVREVLPMYAAISPFYLLFAVFGLFPILFSIVLSFMDWDGMGEMSFVGLAQYKFLLTDVRFWNAVGNTFIIWFLSTIPMLFLAMVIAFLLHQNIRFTKFYRVAFFLPNVTSMVAMAIVFGSVFSDTFGLVNSALTALGLDAVAWLSSPWGIKITIAMMVIWRFTGYNAIIYLAGLQSIPTDLYDAAKVDGANLAQVFLRITVPMMRPIILFTVITSTIGGLSLFTEPQVLLGDSGGAGEAGMTIVLYQYNQAFTQFDFGYGSAIAWALFLIAAVFAIINWRLVSGRGDDATARRPRLTKEARR
ncbi:sugar ABC transporter permease [Brachybacterium sp.]|uniref:carbohydrate ABC transporter permease n=1 Tax=Brachybacterium sp. TaxID=1891286 RepID=UPI002ED4B094